MKTKTLVFTAAVAATLAVAPAYAYAACTSSMENLGPVRAAVSEELAGLAPYDVGADQRDLRWIEDNIGEMVPEWLPATKRIAEERKPDLIELVKKCYAESSSGGRLDLRKFFSCVKNGLLTDVVSHAVTDLPAACTEFSGAMADPDIENKARDWADHWAAEYIEYRETRPGR